MRIFKTRWFNRWARKEGLSDQVLCNAIEEMEKGLVDADLGGHVYKKRVAMWGRGKSGGFRTIIAYKIANRAFFMYGFAKSKRSNIDDDELEVFKLAAVELLANDEAKLKQLMKEGALVEVLNNG